MKDFRKYKITYILMTICVIMYAISTVLYGIEMSASDALRFFGYNPVYVYYFKQYYRIITANFIHFGIFHIVVNCYSLYNVGTFVERVLDTVDYIIVIVASLLCTNGIPYILYLFTGFGATSVSGGISGVIFGLLGCIAALALVVGGGFEDVFSSILPSIILMLILSVTMSSISLSGHVCGMIGGFVSTYIILQVKKNLRYRN